MKTKHLLILASVAMSLSLTACDPGTLEYGYNFNPKNVLYKVFKILKDGDPDGDWILLFSGRKMICTYGSEQGISSLINTIGNFDTALDRFSLEEPVLIQSGASEQYKARVIRNSDHKVIFTATIGCTHESGHHYCSIADLENHILGTPSVPACED